jgi:tetratricopeptide (TPR) repeat protein
MQKTAFSPRLRDEASFLRGLLLADQNESSEALNAFEYARQSSSQDISKASSLNAALMALKDSNLDTFERISKTSQDDFTRSSLQLERALWKTSNGDLIGPSELESFIVNNPGHLRENEARLALAAASVMISPFDVDMARAQINVITPRLTDADNQYRITKILIRAEELAQNWKAAADAAEQFIANYSKNPNIPYIKIKLGEAYFHNEDYNKARRILQEISEKYPASPYAPYASFQAAMAARLGGTTQAREECLAMFQKIIDGEHTHLADEARIQKGRVLIDLRRYEEAEACLEPLLKSKQTSISLRRSAGILMADCLHRQGPGNTANYDQAIGIYNQLLSENGIPLAWKNRIHFLRGQTYESMSQWAKAFGSYYDVIVGNYPAPSDQSHHEEWLWFYRCGFKALSMLEREQRWGAAVKLARRIASFDGPRAEEATQRANSLAKKHMIWEEHEPTSAGVGSDSNKDQP